MRKFCLAVFVTFIHSGFGCADILWEDNLNQNDLPYDVFTFIEGRDGAVFEFDYSAIGIPEAPNSTASGTTGVKLFANDPFEDTTNRPSAVQIAPKDLADTLTATESYIVSYDLWMNVNGPLPGGGGGSTEAMMVGVGFSAIGPIEAGNTDGTYFTITGESGVETDIRSFTNDGFNGLNEDDEPVNLFGNALDVPYFQELFPGGIDVAALPIQGGQDNQTGITRAGQMAFQWHEVKVTVEGNVVSFFVNDTLIARDKDAAIDGTVFVGHADYFGSETDIPAWNFSLIDNLRIFTPLAGDFDRNGELDFSDIDLLSQVVRDGSNDGAFDLNGDAVVDQSDRSVWINDLKRTWFGDSDFDGEFSSGDFVKVFQAGEYEDNEVGNSTWATGDWNGDGDFDTTDFVLAFQEGGFERGPRDVAVSTVPEPNGWMLVVCCVLTLITKSRFRQL